MENIWGELKKIEAQAMQITSEAQNKANHIEEAAKQSAQKLIDDSKNNAEIEAQKLYDEAVAKAHKEHEEQLKATQVEINKLQLIAEKHMEQAVDIILKAELEEN